MSTLTQALKEEARRLGFALAGVTTPEPPPHTAVYLEWLAAGRHATMDYLATERARERRLNPRAILPECQSILVLAIPYSPGQAILPDASASLLGRVASYAWGRDYHRILPERLRALVAFLEKAMGRPVVARCYTDTGPVLERDLAQRAGLGWIGRNTNLIHPRLGSYLLLAEIFLDVPLEPDEPFSADYCGVCRRCVEACPTSCIRPDRTLDARRCIAYLTIEHRGAIPLELRERLGNWVFGCDLCQIVCPWNRFAGVGPDPAFRPRPDLPQPDLRREMALTADEFRQKFQDSPVRRAGYDGYRRNVAVALGNSRRPEARPVLARALEGADALLQEHIRWALEQIERGPR